MKYIYLFLIFSFNIYGMEEEQLIYRGMIYKNCACNRAYIKYAKYEDKMREQRGQGKQLSHYQKKRLNKLDKQWGEEVGKMYLEQSNWAFAASPNN